jgi:hypothetical protein
MYQREKQTESTKPARFRSVVAAKGICGASTKDTGLLLLLWLLLLTKCSEAASLRWLLLLLLLLWLAEPTSSECRGSGCRCWVTERAKARRRLCSTTAEYRGLLGRGLGLPE